MHSRLYYFTTSVVMLCLNIFKQHEHGNTVVVLNYKNEPKNSINYERIH